MDQKALDVLNALLTADTGDYIGNRREWHRWCFDAVQDAVELDQVDDFPRFTGDVRAFKAAFSSWKLEKRFGRCPVCNVIFMDEDDKRWHAEHHAAEEKKAADEHRRLRAEAEKAERESRRKKTRA